MADSGGGSSAAPAAGQPGEMSKTNLGNEAQRSSWAEVAKGGPRPPAWTRHRISPRDLEAVQSRFTDAVVVPEEDLEGVRAEWRNTTILVRSLGRNIPVDWVVKEVRRVGKMSYDAEGFMLADGCSAIRFANEEDREAVLKNGPWTVAGQLLAVDRWRPNFIPGSSGIGRVVVWLRLPGLPLDYWKKETIFRIAARAGNPLELDGFTAQGKRYGFARVKIELDISDPLTPGTFVQGRSEGRDEKFWQGFMYESLPAPCPRCGRIGHSSVVCEFPLPTPMGKNTGVEEPDRGGNAKGKGAAEAPPQAERKVDGSGEEGFFGPWLVTNRLGFRKATSAAPRRTEKKDSAARKISSPIPSGELGRTGDSSVPSGSPIDLEGWQKPTKVARRRTPEKDVSVAGAGAVPGVLSQPGLDSGSGAESGSRPESSRAEFDLDRAEARPKSSHGPSPGGSGPSPMKRARSPPGDRKLLGPMVGAPSQAAGRATPSTTKAGRPMLTARRRSKSSPPPSAAARGRPPRVVDSRGVAGASLRGGVATGLRLAPALSVAVGVPGSGESVVAGEVPGVTELRLGGAEDRCGGGSLKPVASVDGSSSDPCQMARTVDGSSLKAKGKTLSGDSGVAVEKLVSGGKQGEPAGLGSEKMASACHMAQGE
ncbi:collagen alpha-2(I) chain-like [Phoenix dactylifera]|uniref:Collagen alpha-2(I) chain-like n=1 Tax=Phoenix dactylifera TaxID=42345 RepID=A0A8B9AKA2_PHODC|nr:collagen alpha-2(I) chain-like [Phoenix dactylifera]